jgi:hypothetical protein
MTTAHPSATLSASYLSRKDLTAEVVPGGKTAAMYAASELPGQVLFELVSEHGRGQVLYTCPVIAVR